MRLSLRISKLKQGTWRWFYEDLDRAGNQVIGESQDFNTWREAEQDARAKHPGIDVRIHAVRGTGTTLEDSLSSLYRVRFDA